MPALVLCARERDTDAWRDLWTADTSVQTGAAAGLSALCAHLLARIGQLTGANPDDILREFAVRVAAAPANADNGD